MLDVISKYAKSTRKFVLEILAVVVSLVFILALENSERSRIVAEERDRASSQVQLLQEELSTTVITGLHILERLRNRLTQNPEWTQQDYAAQFEHLIEVNPDIRNIAIAEDYVVQYVAPLTGNEAALGLDYRTVPEQLSAVQNVIDQGHTIVTNVVDLVQGGSAIIGRVPYFITGDGTDDKWGLLSIAWDIDVLFKPLAEFNADSPYRTAIRSIAEYLDGPVLIYGEASVFDRDPVQIVLQLEGNAWEFAIVPHQGWSSTSLSIWMTRGVGLLILCLFLSLSLGRRRKLDLIRSLIREISERDKAKSAARDSEDRLSLIMNSVPVGITYVDAEQRYVYANQHYLEMEGRLERHVIGKSMQTVLTEEILEKSAAYIKRALTGEKLQFENSINRGTNKIRHFIVDYVPHFQLDGTVAGFFTLVQDVTELKKYSAALIASERRFRSIFDTIRSGMIVVDTQGIIQSINPAGIAMFGYKSREIIGKHVSVLMPESYRSDYVAYLREFIKTGTAKKLGMDNDVLGLRKNGETFPVSIEFNEMKIDNDTLYLSSVDDLTEIHSLESQLRQSQKLESVGQLTGGIAHDFNNLLAVVQGNLSLLVEDTEGNTTVPSENVLDLVRPAIEASERAADLAQRLLAFSRKQVLQPQIDDINERVSGMEGMLRRTLGETVELKINLKTGHWKAFVDPSMLESAILNLALNARDATPAGGQLTIETADIHLDDAYVDAHPEASVGDYIRLSVRDTGCGISPDILERIFDPFFTTKPIGEGSGLGLSMVHGFVRQSGGHITMDTQPGEGTTATIYLPRSADQGDVIETAMPSSSGDGHETILVVEDEEAVRYMVVQMLQRLGYTVIEASDGASAMEMIGNTDEVDLLLTDVVLAGGMSGPDIANAAYGVRPEMKILYMSGYTESTVLDYDQIREGTKLLNKPFSVSELASKVKESIDTPIALRSN